MNVWNYVKYFFQRVVKWRADLTQREIVSFAPQAFLCLAHVQSMFPIETNELANVGKGRERIIQNRLYSVTVIVPLRTFRLAKVLYCTSVLFHYKNVSSYCKTVLWSGLCLHSWRKAVVVQKSKESTHFRESLRYQHSFLNKNDQQKPSHIKPLLQFFLMIPELCSVSQN